MPDNVFINSQVQAYDPPISGRPVNNAPEDALAAEIDALSAPLIIDGDEHERNRNCHCRPTPCPKCRVGLVHSTGTYFGMMRECDICGEDF